VLSKVSDAKLQQKEGLYVLHQCNLLNGGTSKRWFHYYMLACITFTASDLILAYSKFVTKEDRELEILATYFLSLLLLAWSAFEDIPCIPCLKQDKKDK